VAPAKIGNWRASLFDMVSIYESSFLSSNYTFLISEIISLSERYDPIIIIANENTVILTWSGTLSVAQEPTVSTNMER